MKSCERELKYANGIKMVRVSIKSETMKELFKKVVAMKT